MSPLPLLPLSIAPNTQGPSVYSVGTDDRLERDENYDYLYDDNGSMIRRTSHADQSYEIYTWNHRGKMVSSTAFSATHQQQWQETYYYDALGRLATTVTVEGSGGNPSERHAIFDGTDLAELLLELDSSDRVTKTVLSGPSVDMAMAEESISYDANGAATFELSWPMGDHQGTANAILKAGSVVYQPLRTAFGEKIDNTGTESDSAFGFQGQLDQSKTEFGNFRARQMQTNAGRFISQDPIRFASGQTNFYQFVGNHPQMGTDPSGMLEPPFELANEGSRAVSIELRQIKELIDDPMTSSTHRKRLLRMYAEMSQVHKLALGKESTVGGIGGFIKVYPSSFVGALSGESRTDWIDDSLYYIGKGSRSVGVMAGGLALAVPTGGQSMGAGGYLVLAYEVDQGQAIARSLWTHESTLTMGSSAIHSALGNDSSLAHGLGLGYDFAGLVGILRNPGKASKLVDDVATDTLYVHLTESQYEAVTASGYLGKGYQGLSEILLPPLPFFRKTGFDEGRIWATAYSRDELTGLSGKFRALSEGIVPWSMANRTRTIEITGDAADAFSRPRGLGFSLNPVGWLKGAFGTQRQFRGQLRYDGQGVISSLDGAVLYTGWQMAAYRIGELERLTIYGGASVGAHYARSLAIEWNHDR